MPVWKPRRVSPISTAINETLPISSDVELLQGGVIYECMLHEMLIQKKKMLAVKRYCEMAARLTTPGTFPFFLLHGVPVAFAGKCVEDTQAQKLRSSELQGPVVIEPVI